MDSSEQSHKALAHAVAIAEKFGAELTLLDVIPRDMVPILDPEGFLMLDKDIAKYQDRVKAFSQNVLNDAESKVSSEHPNLNVRTILREGRLSDTIVDVAEKEGYDLIVMGSRGMGGIKGWLLGSTSHRVAASCKKPVMIIK